VHRFKVQRRKEVKARDRSNKKFLLAEIWQTVSVADRLATAEQNLQNAKHDQPRSTFRLTEEWPFGSSERVIR